MKRLFYQTKIYDYSKVTEADKHQKEMEAKGWKAKVKDETTRETVYDNGQTDFPYSVEYYKEI